MTLIDDIRHYYLPFTDRLALKKPDGMLVLGINGAQGSGKSTLAEIIKRICNHQYGWTVAVLSLDDLYLSCSARQKLAADVHPLLMTRGVPGTHDVRLGLQIISQLSNLKSGQTMRLPRFDKARDEPFPEKSRREQQGPVDLLVFEGWCVCADAQAEAELVEACNVLEAKEDADGVWRQFVNRQLRECYPPLFAFVDVLMYLNVPDMDAVSRWRSEQEEKLALLEENTARKLMDAVAMTRFIRHFERLTKYQRVRLPEISDVVCTLDASHCVRDLRYRRGFSLAE